MADLVAVVPLAPLARAKTRLAEDLDRDTRLELVAWMLGRVLSACAQCDAIDDVVVVAGDRGAAALAHGQGVRAFIQSAPGLPAALTAADKVVAHAAASLVVASDLPLLEPYDVAAVAEQGREGPVVVVAPTHDGGTGALLRRPATVIGTHYGPESAAAHTQHAQRAGVPVVRLDLPRLALDVDTAGQLVVAGLGAWLERGRRPAR